MSQGRARTVAVLGASPKPERYSNKAVKLLLDYGYRVVPVNPGHQTVEGIATVRSLRELAPGSVDTVTVYVGPEQSGRVLPELLGLAPRRVIFNPGAESSDARRALSEKGVEVLDACTLVLLRTNRF